MKKLLTLILILNFVSIANAVTLKSGSKVKIYISLFQGSSVCGDEKSGNAAKALKGGMAALRKSGSLQASLREALTTGSGNCELVHGFEQGVILESKGDTVDVPANTTVVAWKTMKDDKGWHNPMPAVFTASAGGTITLVTRKDKKGGILSMLKMNDGGLKAVRGGQELSKIF